MTALARRTPADLPVWTLAPSLRRLGNRTSPRPRLSPKWPCLQVEMQADAAMVDALAQALGALDGVIRARTPLDAPGLGFGLEEEIARGQPEAFIGAPCWVNLRPDGSMHLGLRPEWAQKVVNHGWATIHPFARYMAGAVPPQSLVVFAPRDRRELSVTIRIATAAHGYAMGRIGDVILPDTRW
jgi:hypothetical protein